MIIYHSRPRLASDLLRQAMEADQTTQLPLDRLVEAYRILPQAPSRMMSRHSRLTRSVVWSWTTILIYRLTRDLDIIDSTRMILLCLLRVISPMARILFQVLEDSILVALVVPIRRHQEDVQIWDGSTLAVPLAHILRRQEDLQIQPVSTLVISAMLTQEDTMAISRSISTRRPRAPARPRSPNTILHDTRHMLTKADTNTRSLQTRSCTLQRHMYHMDLSAILRPRRARLCHVEQCLGQRLRVSLKERPGPDTRPCRAWLLDWTYCPSVVPTQGMEKEVYHRRVPC